MILSVVPFLPPQPTTISLSRCLRLCVFSFHQSHHRAHYPFQSVTSSPIPKTTHISRYHVAKVEWVSFGAAPRAILYFLHFDSPTADITKLHFRSYRKFSLPFLLVVAFRNNKTRDIHDAVSLHRRRQKTAFTALNISYCTVHWTWDVKLVCWLECTYIQRNMIAE